MPVTSLPHPGNVAADHFVGLRQRQRKGERAPRAALAFQMNLSEIKLHEFLGNVQSQAEALGAAARLGAKLLVPLEDGFLKTRVDPGTIVRDADDHALFGVVEL